MRFSSVLFHTNRFCRCYIFRILCLSLCLSHATEQNHSMPDAKFCWKAQMLSQCISYHSKSYTSCEQIGKEQVSRDAGNVRACTNDPSTPFSCNTPDDEGCSCVDAIKSTSCSVLQIDQATSFAGFCLPVIVSVEDNWMQIPTAFLLSDNNGICEEQTAGNFAGMFRVTISVNFGLLDIYNREQSCPYTFNPSLGLQECDLTNLDLANQVARLSFKVYLGQQVPRRDMIIYGSYAQVYSALQNSTYRGNSEENTVRLTKPYYNPITARITPYETMNMTVEYAPVCKVDGATTWWKFCNFTLAGNLTQLVHISPINNAPEVIAAPYELSASACSGVNPDQACYFGEYRANEDDPTVVSISGVVLGDIDLYEVCSYDNPECKTLDVTVRSDFGAIALNTRSNLQIYDNARNVQGFLAALSWAQLAVQVVQYQIVLDTEITTSSSGAISCQDPTNEYCIAALHFNTQHSGNREFVYITASDQGYTGIDGTKAVTTLTINITIVAVNDPPAILFEDQSTVLGTLGNFSITDVDADEQIDSAMSRANWTFTVSAQQNLNLVQVTLEVYYGYLTLQDATNLRAVQYNQTFILTIAGTYGHDVCRIKGAADDIVRLQSFNFGRALGPYSQICLPASTGCQNGAGGDCACFRWSDTACQKAPVGNNQIVLYIQKNDSGLVNGINSDDWQAALTASIAATDNTCGGLPYFPAPNAFSFGKKCKSDSDCASTVLPACTRGVDCYCCANLTHICSEQSDCSVFDQGSLCGCKPAVPGSGKCGPFCTAPDLKICNITAIITNFENNPLYGGNPCTYFGPDPLGAMYPGIYADFVDPAIRRCAAPAYVQFGSDLSSDLDLLTVELSKISFLGKVVDVNKGLSKLEYVTKPHYNRLYRPPISEQDPLTFNPAADSTDTFQIYVSDLGNSGGTVYDPKTATSHITLRVAAVNDRPSAEGPLSIYAREDTPYDIIAATDAGNNLVSGLRITDPDSGDYGFNSGVFTANLSCTNGRLYLNETFLTSTGVSNVRIVYKYWGDPRQEFRGLHAQVSGVATPIFGDGCQRRIQCTDDSSYVSSDSKYGFHASDKYGIVYSPQYAGGPPLGCGFCPENSGNKFLSIQGVLADLNQALSLVTYLPDPNFNTRTGTSSDAIILNVSDGGDMGNDASSKPLTDSRTILVVVDSVNDRPIIGRRISKTRTLITYSDASLPATTITDVALLPINKTLDSFCSTLPPAGEEYSNVCGATTRQFIDIDEDTDFVITGDVLWIDDVDAAEAQNMISSRRFCCASGISGGCYCKQNCPCPQPGVCSAAANGQPPGGPGQILVNISSVNGLLTFYPPPGRSIFDKSELSFLTLENGILVACPNQLVCMQNVSWMFLLTSLTALQTGIQQFYLGYRGKPQFFGLDVISVSVSDQGYTDDCYNDNLTTTESLDVRVVAINDQPEIYHNFTVLHYAQGLRCYVDYFVFPRILGREGLNPSCYNTTDSNIPPGSELAGFVLSDIDMNVPQAPHANMTIVFTIGSQAPKQSYAGSLFLMSLITGSDVWHEQFRNSNGLWAYSIQGKMELLNKLMTNLRYDADPQFAGYLPIFLVANDMGNFGECSGNHVCGNLQVTCLDHTVAGPHEPAGQGLTTLQLDVTIDPPQSCIVISSALRSDCETCNIMPGCGWCPGFCGSAGKCMIAGKGGPLFDTCPIRDDGSAWLMCGPPSGTSSALLISIIVPLLSILLIFALFSRWVVKKYGTFVQFLKEKQKAIYRTGKKLHLMPSADANWLQFLFLIVQVAIIAFVVLFNQSGELQCEFQYSYFLDHISSLTMNLDNCNVRFVPARNKGYPDNMLPEPKVRFAITADPQIKLDASICQKDQIFVLENSRDDFLRYAGYYCNVEVIVPDRIVMPSVTVMAIGNNITTVRAGPLDVDSAGFGLDFGPNTLSLLGTFLVGRLSNISAKNIVVDIIHGSMIATDILVTTSGTFTSEDADIVVTSTQSAHVTFWQKQSNLVCLTAASGSLYVDDSCELECEYPQVNTSSSQSRVLASEDRVLGPESSEVKNYGDSTNMRKILSVNPWLCTNNLTVGSVSKCTEFDPIAAQQNDTCPAGAAYQTKSAVPKITGCYNLDLCTLDTSQKCLCKPYCDMASLSPPGQCNSLGQCCQVICGGYSKADMFPTENQPRCGSVIDPVTMPWCNGLGMAQQFQFTSTSGQISFQVLDAGSNTSVSSFMGSSPSSSIDSEIKFRESDVNSTNDMFHPDGSNFPEKDVFYFDLSGPGTVERSQGSFVWVSKVDYLLFDPYFLHFFSLGVLSVRAGYSSLNLNPGFCPAYVDTSSAQFNSRLISIHSLLIDSLQSNPPTMPLPRDSMLVFKFWDDLPRQFYVDPTTNEDSLSYFSRASNSLGLTVVYIAIALPALFALYIVYYASSAYFAAVAKYTKFKLEENKISKNVSMLLRNERRTEEGDLDEFARNERLLKARTNFFYMFEEGFADPEEQKTILAMVLFVIAELLIVLCPGVIVYYAARLLKQLYTIQRCEFRPDFCSCLQEQAAITTLASIIVVVVFLYFLVAVAEMASHFLFFKLSIPARILRIAYLFLFFAMTGFGLFYIMAVILFILLGVLIRPQASIPYAIAVVGVLAIMFAFHLRLSKFQGQIEQQVRNKIKAYQLESKMSSKIPRELLTVLVEKNLKKVMRGHGLSTGRRALLTMAVGGSLALISIFLILGFRAFTDLDNTQSSFINSGLMLLVVLIGQHLVMHEGDSDEMTEKVSQIVKYLKKIFAMLLKQIETAESMIGSFYPQMEDAHIGEDVT